MPHRTPTASPKWSDGWMGRVSGGGGGQRERAKQVDNSVHPHKPTVPWVTKISFVGIVQNLLRFYWLQFLFRPTGAELLKETLKE